MNINADLLQWFINFLIKKLLLVILKREYVRPAISRRIHKPIIRKFEKRKVQSPFIDNIWDADMQLISKFNIGIRFLLCVIDIFSTYA